MAIHSFRRSVRRFRLSATSPSTFFARSVVCVLAAGLAFLGSVGFAQDASDDVDMARERARGWAPPTPEDVALYRNLGHRLEALHLNSLALRRLHDADLAEKINEHALLIRRPGRGSITRPVQASRNKDDPHSLEPGLGVSRLPRAVDNSALPCFPPLFDQGRLESCTAIVSTYYQLTHTIGLMRGWDQSRLSNAYRFSPAWTYNLTNNGANTGVSLLRAYAALAAHGATSLADFPYRGTPAPATNYRRWAEDPALWRQALTNRVDRFGLVDARQPVLFLRELKRLLLNGHVLTGSTAIDGWNRRFVASPPDGEEAPRAGESICTNVAADSRVNHAVTLVGYDDDIWVDLDADGRASPGEFGAFKIANSWGRADWNRGFRWLHYAAVARYGAAPRTDDWRGAFWLDRVYWLIPYRYYQPARILELDVTPALRGDIRVAVGAAHAPDAAPGAFFDRREVPNLAFAQNGGPFGFAGVPRPDASLLRLNLDLTPTLGPDASALFLNLTHPAGAGALRGAFLFEPLSGARQPLVFGSADRSGTRWSQAPVPPDSDAPGPVLHGLPSSLAIQPGQPASLSFTVETSRDSARSLWVGAFSSRASVLTEQEIVVTRESGGRHRLDLYPRPNARGSALVLLHVTDGWTRSTTTLRVNLETETNTAPIVTTGAIRREEGQIILPLRLSDAETAPEKLTVFFDTPQVDSILDFTLTGKGAERELRLELKPGANADLSISAFDGELIGVTEVSLRSESASLSAIPILAPIAARGD